MKSQSAGITCFALLWFCAAVIVVSMLGERRALAAEAAPVAATPAQVHLASTSPTSRVDKVSAQHAPPTPNASHPAALDAAGELAKTSAPAPAASTAGQLDSNKLGLVAAMLLIHHARVEAELRTVGR
jgi:hypothetical protein